MKVIKITLLILISPFLLKAQLINNGGTVNIEHGTTVKWKSLVKNNSSNTNIGLIDIKGDAVLQVEGDFINSSSVNMSPNSSLVFNGDNSANISSGGATFTNVKMDKTSNNVSLLDEMRISSDLNFVGDNNKILIGDNNLVFAPSASITSADENEYIVADGDANTGVVSKELSANEVFKFEVGDATNYTPLDANITGSAYSSATVDVNVVQMQQPNVPSEATDYIARYWNVDQSGITAFSADLEGTYAAGDVTGTAGEVKGAHYESAAMDWTYDESATGANLVLGTVAESGDFTGTNSFGRVKLKAMLDGAFSGGTMSTTLNSSALLPTTSPYGDGSTVASGFFAANTDIVDWILLESRNTTTPATLEGSGSAFLKSDGTIVALDGTSNPFIKNAGTTGYVVVKHRNHLSICTGISIPLDGSASLQDFTDSEYTAFGSNGLKNNGGTMTLWSGDANSDGSVLDNASPSDVTAIANEVLSAPGNTGFFGSGPLSNYTGLSSVYSIFDINLDGTVFDNASPSDVTNTANIVLCHPLNTGFFGSGPLSNFIGVTSQVPE